jgi:glycosyltransferase involved in cell wall biosynthesis
VYRQISDSLFWTSTPLRRKRVKLGLGQARAVVALWDGAAKTLQSSFSVPESRIHVIPNGIPSDAFHVPSTQERQRGLERFGLPDGTPIILSIGALTPEKGVDISIAVTGEMPDAHLLVCGDGPESANLKRIAGRVAPGRIHFAGTLVDPFDAYAVADVVLMPSRGGDSMPAVLIEAGLCGIGVVSTPVAAIPKVVVDGSTGYLVPIGDVEGAVLAVRRVLETRPTLGDKARRHCLAQFEIGTVAHLWEQALASCLATRSTKD